MKTKFLHIIFLINALWLLSSCSSQDPSEDDLCKGAEVTFSVADQSRTAMVSDLEYPGSCFAIFGDMKMIYKDDKLKDEVPTTNFNNIPVSYRKEPEAGWFYDNTQYWFPAMSTPLSPYILTAQSQLHTATPPYRSHTPFRKTSQKPPISWRRLTGRCIIVFILPATLCRLSLWISSTQCRGLTSI